MAIWSDSNGNTWRDGPDGNPVFVSGPGPGASPGGAGGGTGGNIIGPPPGGGNSAYPLPQLFPYAEPIVQQQTGGGIAQAFTQPKALMGSTATNIYNLANQGAPKFSLSERVAGGFKSSAQAPGAFDARSASDRIFAQTARRFRENALPGLAARGLAKSGPGVSAEMQGLEELSVAFADRDFERELSGFNANMQRYQTMSEQERADFNTNLSMELQAYDRQLAEYGANLSAQQLAEQAALGLAALNQMPLELQQNLLQIIAGQGAQAPTPEGPTPLEQLGPILPVIGGAFKQGA